MNDEQTIWYTLMEAIGNPYGVAGLMGNLMAESSLNPLCKTGGNSDIRKLSGREYADQVMSGKVAPDDFAHDSVAFGLAQWRYWSRKKDLYLHIREKGCDIGSVTGQLSFLLKEIKTYKTVWNTLKSANSIEEASDIVLLRYEKPASVTDAVKAKRAALGMKFYTKYADISQKSVPPTYDALISELESIRGNLDRVIEGLKK